MVTLNPIEEKALLLRLRDSDEWAFHQLYNHYKAPLAHKLLYLLKSDVLAEDILQDVFLAIWEGRTSLDPQRSFRGLVFRIARNKVTDIYRKAYRDMALRDQLLVDANFFDDPVEKLLIAQEDMAQVHRALDQLPKRQREVFVLHKLDGKTYKEISELLSISPSAINQHIYRAMQTMAQILHPKVWLLFTCITGLVSIL